MSDEVRLEARLREQLEAIRDRIAAIEKDLFQAGQAQGDHERRIKNLADARLEDDVGRGAMSDRLAKLEKSLGADGALVNAVVSHLKTTVEEAFDPLNKAIDKNVLLERFVYRSVAVLAEAVGMDGDCFVRDVQREVGLK